MEISKLYEIFKQYPQVTTDTRNCPEGSIFFALKGANFNGNEYAEKAIEQGCSYAIVDEPKYENKEKNILLVEDSLKTLQELAKHHRQQFKIPIIGITGTNGKTTTKELVAAVLSKEFNIIYTKGNLNNHIGVPLTLLQIKKEHEIGIIEMGANHVGEIKFLAELADPNYGLITNVGKAHLEGFKTYENIKKTKGELYEYIRNRKEGKIFINYDDSTLKELAGDMTSIYYGKDEKLFVSGQIVANNPFMSFKWIFSRTSHTVQTNLIGDYNLSNALAAVTIGKYFGVKSDLVCQAIEEYTPTNNRSQLRKTEKNYLIVDAYNANPTSMMASLNNFLGMNAENKIVILGDMRELGDDSLAEHQKIADFIIGKNFENVFLIGEHFSKVNTSEKWQSYKNLEEFKKYLTDNPLKNKHILIKGSRGIELEKCIDLL